MIHELIALLVRLFAWLAWQVAEHIYLAIIIQAGLLAAFWLGCVVLK
jgi:hypothetical protein